MNEDCNIVNADSLQNIVRDIEEIVKNLEQGVKELDTFLFGYSIKYNSDGKIEVGAYNTTTSNTIEADSLSDKLKRIRELAAKTQDNLINIHNKCC